jgi:hypothetical protein
MLPLLPAAEVVGEKENSTGANHDVHCPPANEGLALKQLVRNWTGSIAQRRTERTISDTTP